MGNEAIHRRSGYNSKENKVKLPTHIIPGMTRILVYSVTTGYPVWVTTLANAHVTRLPEERVDNLAAFELRENLEVSRFIAKLDKHSKWTKHEGDKIGCPSKQARKIPEKTKKH